MGYIDLVDGHSRRRIDAPELNGPIRIDVGGDRLSVSLPSVATARRSVEDPPRATAEADEWVWGD